MSKRLGMPLAAAIVIAVIACVASGDAVAQTECTWTMVRQCYASPPIHNACCPEPKPKPGLPEYDSATPAPGSASVQVVPTPKMRPIDKLIAKLMARIAAQLMRPR